MSRWWPNRVPLRLRVFFRGAFLLLALATIALALSELREEKRLSYRNYRELFDKNVEQIMARLRHPSGQLALLNPTLSGSAITPLRPLVLPFSAIDFDDKAKAEQAAEMAGCLVQYPDHSQLCVAVGNNPVAGGYIYAVGTFAAGVLTAHTTGEADLKLAHRLLVDVSMRGRTYQWIAPLEAEPDQRRARFRGRLPGFAVDASGQFNSRPDSDFRGWLWQDGRCAAPDGSSDPAQCPRRTFFSVRLPVDLFRQDIYDNPQVVWPPKDLSDIRVRVRALPPNADTPLFDSNATGASAPFALADLSGQLLGGETLRIRRLSGNNPGDLITLTHAESAAARPPRVLSAIIRRLTVEGSDQDITSRQLVATPVGDFEVLLTGDLRSVDRNLGIVANRLSWFVLAMLGAILLTWLAIEARIIRRITLLTKRAASVQRAVDAPDALVLDLQDLRSGDELGLLAGVLSDLLQRVQDDARREQIRAQQEKNMWHAVGHEIRAPLQSLAALHSSDDDPSQRYIERMRQAVRVLYGSASPSEALDSAALPLETLDIRAFLRTVADNAAHAGIDHVTFDGPAEPVLVRANEYSLEDVITHVLANADRYRPSGTPIRMTLTRGSDAAQIHVHNFGAPIDPALLGRIFDYGVSDANTATDQGHRGQGLYVARTYMAKMGGTIEAYNVEGGVEFVLQLPLS